MNKNHLDHCKQVLQSETNANECVNKIYIHFLSYFRYGVFVLNFVELPEMAKTFQRRNNDDATDNVRKTMNNEPEVETKKKLCEFAFASFIIWRVL